MRAYSLVVTTEDERSAKAEAKRLKKRGFFAKAMFSLADDDWGVYVSPPEDCESALAVLWEP